MSRFTTKFGSLGHYEKVAVGRNRQYVLEAIRAHGTSAWSTRRDQIMATVEAVPAIQSTEPNAEGHRGFQLGEFTFRRDEY